MSSVSAYIPQFRLAFFHPRYWLTWIIAGIMWVFTRLPRRFLVVFSYFLGDLYYAANKKRRHIAQKNLKLCFPHWSQEKINQTIRQHLRIYAQAIMDYGMICWGSGAQFDRYIHISGMEKCYRYIEQENKNVIFLSAHYSGVDIAGVALARYFPEISIMKLQKNPLINWLINHGRTRFGGYIFAREQGLLPVVRCMQQGYSFYYIPDEDFGDQTGAFLPFFATQTKTITTLGRLAEITNSVVVPCRIRWDYKNMAYNIELGEAIRQIPSGDRLKDAAQMLEELEKGILQDPSQYIWTLKLFKTRPDGSSLY